MGAQRERVRHPRWCNAHTDICRSPRSTGWLGALRRLGPVVHDDPSTEPLLNGSRTHLSDPRPRHVQVRHVLPYAVRVQELEHVSWVGKEVSLRGHSAALRIEVANYVGEAASPSRPEAAVGVYANVGRVDHYRLRRASNTSLNATHICYPNLDIFNIIAIPSEELRIILDAACTPFEHIDKQRVRSIGIGSLDPYNVAAATITQIGQCRKSTR